MEVNNNLKLLLWNCHSLYNKLSHFKIHIYVNKPHVICLTETWIKSDRLPSFVGYSSYYNLRDQQGGGGTVILIRNDVCTYNKQIKIYKNGFLEIIAITIYNKNNDPIDIMNVYNANFDVTKAEFNHYFNQLSNKTIVVGDFNAKSYMWDTKSIPNMSGNNLVDSLLDFPDLCLLTPINYPTYFHVPTRSYSTLDLCFVSSNLLPNASIKLGEDLGSDHSPINILFNFKPENTVIKNKTRWIFNKGGSWSQWRETLPKAPDSDNFRTDYDDFKANIALTSEQIFKRSNEVVNSKFSAPWWNKKIAQLVECRHKAKNLFRKHPTDNNLVSLRKAEALTKYEIKKAKKEAFHDFAGSINERTPVKKVWTFLNKLSKKKTNKQIIPIIQNNEIYTKSEEKVEIIANHYEKIFNYKLSLQDPVPLLVPLSLALNSDVDRAYNLPFSYAEILAAIKLLKNTSEGYDGVHNLMLKNLPTNYIKSCLNIINKSYLLSEIPDSWKKAVIIPIAKPEKDLTAPCSYRPISLLPCFAKLVEKLICSRLTYHLENNNCLSSSQGGFRRRMNTQYQVAIYEHNIRVALKSKKICLAVFIDLSSAYDLVWHTGLLYKLAMCNVEGKMLKWISEYLKNRKYKVFHEGMYSSERNVTSGVPQGAVISPILFNVMLADLPIGDDVNNIIYADDLLIYAVGEDINELSEKLQLQVNAISKWTKLWGFQINLKKTKAMFHSLKKVVTNSLYLDGSEIPFTRTHKYLGIVFDGPRLTWHNHISQLKTKCLPHMNVMKCIGHSNWGADRNILLRYYVAVIRSKMDYGCAFYSTASNTNLQCLNVIQNSCIRIAIGARKTSPINSIEVESNIWPLKLQRQYIMCQEYFRMIELPTNVNVVKIFHDNFFDPDSNNYRSPLRVPPFIVRITDLLRDLNFPLPCGSNSDTLISPFPPWLDLDNIFITHFSDLNVKIQSNKQIVTLFQYLKYEVYNNYLEIYTDGSKVYHPHDSTGAAFVICANRFNIVQKFKLSPLHSILAAELVAIFKALEYIKNSYSTITEKGLVIYTDSLSGVSLLKNLKLNNYSELVFSIHRLILDINDNYPVAIQYVPAHNGIKGNELADKFAKESHNNESVLEMKVSKLDYNRKVKGELRNRWQGDLVQAVNSTSKGKFLLKIKPKIGYWSWSSHKVRRIETALCRLRLGHAGLNNHLYRFNMKDTNLCDCGEEETISHYFLSCPLHDIHRNEMINSLNILNVPLVLADILGGGEHVEAVQHKIINIIAIYLSNTKKMRDI